MFTHALEHLMQLFARATHSPSHPSKAGVVNLVQTPDCIVHCVVVSKYVLVKLVSETLVMSSFSYVLRWHPFHHFDHEACYQHIDTHIVHVE